MIKLCSGATGGRKCPYPEECTVVCQFDDATTVPFFEPKKKADDLPIIHWDGIQTQLVQATWAFIIVIVLSLVGCVSYIVGKLI